MSFIKKIIPLILSAGLGALAMYFLKPKPKPIDTAEQPQVCISEKVTCPEPVICQEPVVCPEIIPTACPEPKVVTQIVYKDKIIFKDRIVNIPTPVKLQPGCHANWDTGEVIGVATNTMNIQCTVDRQRKHVDTRWFQARPIRIMQP